MTAPATGVATTLAAPSPVAWPAISRPIARIRMRPTVQRMLEFAKTRRGLFSAFAVLHATFAIALLPTIVSGGTMGDLPLYRQWAMDAFEGRGVVGLEADWVYPLLAWLPIGGANLLGAPAYQGLWFLATAALNLAALLVLTRGGRDRLAYPAGYAWMAGLLLLSPVALLRLEGITGPLVVIGMLWLARRPIVASALIVVATWIKVWPATVVGAVLIASRRRAVTMLWVGSLVTGAVALIGWATGGLSHVASFVTEQGARALQLESVIATPWVWLAALDVPGAFVRNNLDIATREVIGPLDAAGISLSTPLMLVTCILVALLMLRARRRALPLDVLSVGAFALAATMIVTNKVGSPQYILWLLPIAVVGMRWGGMWWRRQTSFLLVISLLTTLIFPVFYMPLVRLEPAAVMLLTTRNALLVVLWVAAIVHLWSLAKPAPALVPALARRAPRAAAAAAR